MLGAIEKAILALGSKVSAARKMPVEELMLALGRKGVKAGEEAYGLGKNMVGMAKEHPGAAGAIAGLSGLTGYETGKPDEDEEDILRMYGLR